MGIAGPICLRISERDPQQVSLRHGKKSLTYSELNRRADILAAHLVQTGLRSSASVGICLERSFDWVIAALGVMRAGAAYVAIDEAWPDERVRYVMKDSGAAHLIARADRLGRLKLTTLGVDPQHLAAKICEMPALPARQISRDDLAYIIYTSGTSGYPKGVEITHANLAHLVDWHCQAFDVSTSDRASHLAGLGFDAAGWEIWPYLAAGACVSIVDESARTSPELLQQWLLSEAITVSYIPTALAHPLINLHWPTETPLRFLLTGGEKLQCAPQNPVPFVLVNNYGPTECTVVSTSGVVDFGSFAVPSIGRPIDRVSIYILDEKGKPVPSGAAGEIHIGGAGVGRGYRNLPDLTAGSFLPDPFSSVPGARMYRTGDLGAWLPDGQIEFRGRRDSQEKICGNRIELEEISRVLYRHPKVQFATVHARADESGEKRLVAYVMPVDGELPTSNELHRFLANTLPPYMLPAAFVRLSSLPLSQNGKVDKLLLEAPAPGNLLPPSAQHDVETSDPVCNKLLGIVRQLLRTEAVGPQDDFFLAGGHSLLGTQLILRIRAAFKVDISLKELFEARTVQHLAGKIEQQMIAEVSAMSEEEARKQAEASL
jgi:amino acid adenylation domain-containing protein